MFSAFPASIVTVIVSVGGYKTVMINVSSGKITQMQVVLVSHMCTFMNVYQLS